MSKPKWINELLDRGATAYSRVRSKADRRRLQDLQLLQLVRIKTQKSRRSIIIIDMAQFRQWVKVEFPSSTLSPDTLPMRARNVVERRDSKMGESTHKVQPLLFRWFEAGKKSDLAYQTDHFGVVGVLTDRVSELELPQLWRLLTVENWESFYTLEYESPTSPIMCVYLGGNVSDVVLTAITELTPSPSAVLHFGDYDWAGLAIFQRLEAKLPRAEIYVPTDLDTLLSRYGKRDLVESQPLRGLDLKHPKFHEIVDCISQHNAGLEQEIVAPPPSRAFD
jgi:hypothetical protein